MQEDEISVGDTVRYPRTGTTGRVVELETSGGSLFARLDSTGLKYRIDQLIPAEIVAEIKERGEKADIDRLRRVEDLDSKDLESAFDDVTGVGAG